MTAAVIGCEVFASLHGDIDNPFGKQEVGIYTDGMINLL